MSRNNMKNIHECKLDLMPVKQIVSCCRKFFPLINDKQIAMEKTPSYFDGLPHNLPESIIKNLPNVKLLLIVCEPAKRAFSDYVHEVRHM